MRGNQSNPNSLRWLKLKVEYELKNEDTEPGDPSADEVTR